MKRFLKWFFGILVTLVILVVIAALSLPYIIDPNKYKPQIIAAIKPHMLGRDLKIPGKIKLSVIPWLGVDIGDTVIGNADGFVLKPFMTIKHSRAHIRLLSLLSETPEIGSIEFDGVVVNLQRDAEGRNNWSDLLQASAAAKPGLHKVAFVHTAAADTSGAAPMQLPNLKIDGIHFRDAYIDFDDHMRKDNIILSKLNLDAGPIQLPSAIPLKGRFNYYSKAQGLVAASAFATSVAFVPAAKTITLQDFVMNTNLSGEVLNNKTTPASLSFPKLTVDLGRQVVEAKPFHLKLDKMQSEGRLKLTHFDNPAIQLGLDMDTLDLDSLLPPTTKTVAPLPATTGDAATDKSPEIFAALVPFKNADIIGNVNFKKLIYRKLQFDNVKLNLIARGGLISALPEASLYQGHYEGNVQINVRQAPITINLRQKLDKVPMGPITLAFTGKESMTGSASLQMQMDSRGYTLDQVISQLNGDASFYVRNVELKLMDVEQLVLQEWYDKLKLAEKQQAGKKVTAFDSMRGTFRVQNGVAFNRDFSAVSDRVHLRGQGQFNLAKHTMDYTLFTIPKTSLALKVGNTSYDLKNKEIPTTFTGRWEKPEIHNGLGNVIHADLKQAAQQKVQTKVESEKEKVKEKIQDKLKDLLKR